MIFALFEIYIHSAVNRPADFSSKFSFCIAKVISLHKSGSLSNIDNYRPLSVLPALSKILERMFYNQLLAHFEENGLLFTHQFGFRSKRSTEQAVNMFLDHIRREADKGKLTGALFVDLSKAFDNVSHSVLLSKLHSYGVMGTEFQSLTNYLFDRKHVVHYRGAFSNAIPLYIPDFHSDPLSVHYYF